MEAVSEFLVTKLNFPDWKHVLEADPEDFLRKFVKKHACNICFHSLGLVATPISVRRVPSSDDIVANGFSGRGGMCNQINLFVKYILDSLGFDTTTVAASWTVSPVPGTHVITVAQLGQGKLYLVDVGCGLPIQEPVPLHNLPFKDKAGGYGHEYRMAPDGVSYQRIQHGGSLIKGDFKDHDEEVRYTFQLKSVTQKDILPAMTYVFTHPDYVLNRLPYILAQFDDTLPDSDILFILVWGLTLVKGKRDSREVINFESYSDLQTALGHLAPTLDQESVSNAVTRFKESECLLYKF